VKAVSGRLWSFTANFQRGRPIKMVAPLLVLISKITWDDFFTGFHPALNLLYSSCGNSRRMFMKRLTLLMISLCLMGTAGLASAQTPVPGPTVLPGATLTRIDIRARIKSLEARINADSKVGKLTTVQANALLASLQEVKDQKNADYAENGKKELTREQIAELNEMLDEDEQSLTNTNGIKNSN
jgi:hypothetical protein